MLPALESIERWRYMMIDSIQACAPKIQGPQHVIFSLCNKRRFHNPSLKPQPLQVLTIIQKEHPQSPNQLIQISSDELNGVKKDFNNDYETTVK